MPELLKADFHTCADGGRMRYVRLEPKLKPHGTILVAPGRREFIEKKHAELGDAFLSRGYRLIIFEWRGQGLSSHFLKGPMHQRDHITDFAIYLDDLKGFYNQVVKPAIAGPLLFCGHSLGGHLLLRFLAEEKPAEVAGTILTAPMQALTMKMAQRVAQSLCRIAVQAGHGEDYAPGQHDYAAHDRVFTGNPLTNDPERFAIIQRYFDAVPDMAVGGVTWAWLYASLQSMQKADEPEYLAAIKAPVLSIIGGKDHVTPAAQVLHGLKALPHSESLVIAGALHDVLNEIDAYRLEAWAAIDQFLARVVG